MKNLRHGRWTIKWAASGQRETEVLVELWDFGQDPFVYSNNQALHFIWHNGEQLLIPFPAIRVADYEVVE